MQVSDHFTKIGQKGPAAALQKKRNEPTSSNDVGTGHQVVVDGLPPLVRQNDIRSLFGQFGKITNVTVDESKLGAVGGGSDPSPPLRISMPLNHKCSGLTFPPFHLIQIYMRLHVNPKRGLNASFVVVECRRS
ncbi:RNA binding protein squid [Echinococcus multilocularis]|uniref:RNA binding protein squid n=1 Tax=Echinococcus multilocularis TaxID=6211 RepID=A0A0S4MLQ9_ECHMU|nr:RNA binding protein squid [Echinococcus multilocularis]